MRHTVAIKTGPPGGVPGGPSAKERRRGATWLVVPVTGMGHLDLDFYLIVYPRAGVVTKGTGYA